MKIASITEAKNNLSALIDGLKGGSPVLILDRGRPVARLEAVSGLDSGEGHESLSRLIRSGLVRPPRRKLDPEFFNSEPPRPADGASALAFLLEERREGR